ncbi:MAG: hypothetical protein PHP73_05940, partial [Candidatus Omnitrophica bacterium]|nr:hypothetical protein [Candidatus Omnitrophota bacterium]
AALTDIVNMNIAAPTIDRFRNLSKFLAINALSINNLERYGVINARLEEKRPNKNNTKIRFR